MSGKLLSLIVVLLFASVALKEVQHKLLSFGTEESITLTTDELYLSAKAEKEGLILYTLTYPESLGSKKDNVKFIVSDTDAIPNDDQFVSLTNCTEASGKGETVLAAAAFAKANQYAHIKYENLKPGVTVKAKVGNYSTGTMIGVAIIIVLVVILICVIVACIIKKCCC